MATKRYSISRGGTRHDIVEATGLATVTGEIELTVDLATVSDKYHVIRSLEEIIKHIRRDNWPPA